MRILALLLILSVGFAVEIAPPGYVVKWIANNRWYRNEPPPFTDPIPALSPEDLAIVLKKGKLKAEPLIEQFVERVQAHYVIEGIVPESLVTWFSKHPEIAREFWLALDPQYDDIAAACDIFETLRARDEKTLEQFHQLAIAMAVVHDSPDAMVSSRYSLIWAVTEEQWPDLPEWMEIWDHFTSKKNQRMMLMPSNKLVWPLLVHIADLDLPTTERNWASKKYLGKRELGSTYQEIDYDYDKLNTRQPKLGTRDYTLLNLLTYGGVCVDQAHYSSRVMKNFGLPAAKVSGYGRYGGIGHAWTGYLEVGRKIRFVFTGRYFGDYYYSGDIFDPQTRTVTKDREVAMLLDGALNHYGKYTQARTLGPHGTKFKFQRTRSSCKTSN